MLVSQILDYAKGKFPKAANTTLFTEASMLVDLDLIHKEEYEKFMQLTNYYKTDKTLETVADQLEYTLPTNCTVENIVGSQILITIDTEDYIFGYADGEQDITDGYYYRYGSAENKIEITRDGKAIDTSGYVITIKFYPKPTAITATTQTPDINEDWHNLLCYRLINRLAMTGETPDADIANIWQSEYDMAYEPIEKRFKKNKTKTTTTIKRIQNVYGGW